MDDANLNKLTLKEVRFTPDFNKNITEYHAIVPSDIDRVEIEATTSDRGASYVVKFNEKDGQKCILKDGQNKIIIEVSSEDGTLKHYTIYCVKLSASDAILKSLRITNLLIISPEFKSDIYEYQATVAFDLCHVKIDTEVDDPKCEVSLEFNGSVTLKSAETSFNVELNHGNSQLNIIVKSPNKQKSQVEII